MPRYGPASFPHGFLDSGRHDEQRPGERERHEARGDKPSLLPELPFQFEHSERVRCDRLFDPIEPRRQPCGERGHGFNHLRR